MRIVTDEDIMFDDCATIHDHCEAKLCARINYSSCHDDCSRAGLGRWGNNGGWMNRLDDFNSERGTAFGHSLPQPVVTDAKGYTNFTSCGLALHFLPTTDNAQVH